VVALAAVRKAPRMVVAGGLVVLAGLMLWNVYMGVFHAALSGSGGLVRPSAPARRNSAAPAVSSTDCRPSTCTRCDEAAWRFLGLSLAGYNALISAALAAVALWGAKAAARPS